MVLLCVFKGYIVLFKLQLLPLYLILQLLPFYLKFFEFDFMLVPQFHTITKMIKRYRPTFKPKFKERRNCFFEATADFSCNSWSQNKRSQQKEKTGIPVQKFIELHCNVCHGAHWHHIFP